MIAAKVICDSTSYLGKRLTTFILEYPRYIHSELMTHRVLSKNSASSRAIPFPKFVEMIRSNPTQPLWTENMKGMQGPVITDEIKVGEANRLWTDASQTMSWYANQIHRLGVHKQNVNRLLEPWMHIRIILTGTDFEGWFTLRDHPKAHPEIAELARMMRFAMEGSTPRELKPGNWHIPFINSPFPVPDGMDMMETVLRVSAARCARVSYNNFEGTSDMSKDIQLFNRLFSEEPRHCSPAEHQARVPFPYELKELGYNWKFEDEKWRERRGKYHSNLTGYVQLRKLIECGEFI